MEKNRKKYDWIDKLLEQIKPLELPTHPHTIKQIKLIERFHISRNYEKK